MNFIKFIHCADLHIDSPFKGISNVNTELKELFYQSTFNSFNNIIELAIKEEVNCVMISGDIYDGADKSLQAQLKFRNGLQRLSDAGIPSFVVHGNHDPLDSWAATMEWPENVTIFGGEEVECVPLKKGRRIIANIYGISYKTRDIRENLSLQFKKRGKKPAIGLLHSNVGTATGHEPYAPASKADLISNKMDYWALGHVHNYQVINKSNPAIVYSGNSQARNPRESGSKGCCIVELHANGDCDIEFIPTDVVRYEHSEVDITGLESLDEVFKAIQDRCESISEGFDGRHAAIRLTLTGSSALYSELNREGAIDDIIEEVRSYFEGRDPVIWLEKLKSKVRGIFDIESLKGGSDLIADIIEMYESLNDEESEIWDAVERELSPLFQSGKWRKHLESPSRAELLELAKESLNHTVEKLVRED